MKYLLKSYTVIFVIFVLMSSCNKSAEDIEIDEVDTEEQTVLDPLAFDAAINQGITYKVGDTVKFNLEGNSYLLAFYSGVVGNNYEFREKNRFYEILAELSFESNKTPTSSTNIDCAELLYSSDFNGKYDYNNVKLATWLPITNRFNLHTELQSSASDYRQSGSVNISDLFVDDKPIYIAWLCKTNAGSYRTQFRVQQFKLRGIVSDNNTLSSDLYSQNQFDFKWVLNSAAEAQTSSLPVITSTQILWSGAFNNTNGLYKDGYAISKAIVLPRFNAGKDAPTILLPNWKQNKAECRYIYNKPGVYEVVFVASNLSSGATGEIIKKVIVTVKP